MPSASTQRPFHSILFVCTAALAAFAITGCSHRPPGGPGAPADSAEMNIPTLVAKSPFFDGKLLVEATAGRSLNRRGPGGRGAMAGGGGRGRRGGPPGGMGGDGPGGGGGPGMGGGPGGGDSSDGPSIHLQEASFPPVALEVKLTNKSGQTIEIAFVRCKSELGDFAVRPEKLALAPDQSAQPDRMTSQLGLTTTALELTLALKMGGTVETKVLVLKPETPAAATPGAPQP